MCTHHTAHIGIPVLEFADLVIRQVLDNNETIMRHRHCTESGILAQTEPAASVILALRRDASFPDISVVVNNA